ncbi:MAG TPA: aldehyde dehydrogenase [Phycisphaerae bacterium]|nr:aldehyde dehydrogenase [Phycisphaerae bacterium]
MLKIKHYINGELADPASGQYLDNIEPATGKVYSLVPNGDATDVERAVEAAERAFPNWSKTPAAERCRIMLRIADAIDAKADELARAESIDNGKPLSLARSMDIPRAAANLRFFGTAILHAHSETHVTDGVALNYTLRQPRGICGIISPWNLPLYLLTWKVAPAIATGNTVVAKPSEVTPLTAYLLSEICREAGLPAGVLNIVHGLGSKVGAALTAHPKVGTISFTGGTVTGREVAKSCAPLFKKLSLEMGGKNPTIVFADVDMEQIIPATLRAAFANQGQICLCGSRIFVEQPIYDRFVERFTEAAGKLRVGDPLEPNTEQGALVSKAQLEKSTFYVDLAKKEGGKIRCGGGPPAKISDRCKEGYFFQPTVITDLGVDCRVNREEIFGPVAAIVPFSSEDEVVQYANATDYGLASSVWTQNLPRAHRLAERIQSGTVWINCWLVRDLRVPFGGMKQSGLGREGGEEALRFFTEPKNVCIQVPNS